MTSTLVDSPEALATLCADLRAESVLGLDTEFIRERTHVPRLELVQIATPGGEVALVDYGTLSAVLGFDAGPLAALLLDPRILKVFHASEQDLEMLALFTREIPGPIWDTQRVAGLIGYSGRLGYSAMVEHFLGRRPKSGEALTDWSRRPLAPEQLHYAAEDVRHLIPLYERQRARLVDLGRPNWAQQENEMLRAKARARAARREDEPSLYQRVKGWQKLSRRALAILREVAVWRESVAKSRNRPPGTVVRDDLLLEIARRAPDDPEALGRLRGLDPGTLGRHGAAIVAAIAAGKRSPREEWPEAPPPAVELDEAESALASLLFTALQAIAREREVAPSLLTTTPEVQRLAQAHVRGEAESGVSLLEGWRGELVGDTVRSVLRGERSVAWDPEARKLRTLPARGRA